MNKKKITIDRLQNLAIVLLSLSAAFLFLQTPLFGDLAGKTLPELIGDAFSTEETGGSQVELSDFVSPVRIVFTGAYARCGVDALTTLDDGFSRAGTFLSEAIGSAGAMLPSTEETFLSALRGSGIYFDFTTDLPLDILSDALNTTVPVSQDLFVRRAFISSGEDGAVRLYLLDQAGECRSFSTALSASELSAYLDSLNGTGVDFAFSFPESYGMLSPFTLIMDEPTPRHTLRVSSALSEADLPDLLRLAEFNPRTENRYTESSGTIVVRESYGTLRLSSDGTVTYRAGSTDAGSLYTISPDKDGVSLTEAVAAAQKLSFTLLQDRCGAASLYLSSVTPSAEGYSVTLDYVVNGTPLRFSDGSHAASVTIEGHSITAFTIHFRSYELTDTYSLLLPMQLSAAIAQNRYEGCELSVFYVDRGTDTVSVDWIAN